MKRMTRRGKKKRFQWNGVVRMIALIICGTILGVNVYMLNANTIVGNKLPMPFGYGAAVVLSGSMEPTISQGDLVVVKETEEFVAGDIVVFEDTENLVVHRIVAIEEHGEDIMVTTKGDANPVEDKPISIETVKGTMRICIPFVGNIVNFLKTPIGTFLIIVTAIALVEIPRRRERNQDNIEREKLIEEIKRLRDEEKGEIEHGKT